MNLDFLLTKQERDLYPYIRHALFSEVRPYLWFNAFVVFVCTLLFWDALPVEKHLFFLTSIIIFSIILGLHNRHVLKKNLWIDYSTRHWTIISALVYSLLGFAWWVAYNVTMMKHNHNNSGYLTIFISGLTASFAVNLFGSMRRVFSLILLISFGCEIAIGLWLTQDSSFYIIRTVCVFMFLCLALWFTNQRLVSAASLQLENKRLFEKMEEQNHLLENAYASQSKYLSAASHDLRQPLHALALIAHQLQTLNQASVMQKPLEHMNQAIESLSKSFDAMMNLSRLDFGQIKPEIQAFQVQSCLNRIYHEYAKQAEQKNLYFSVVSSKAWLESDESLVYSILSNLVSNALRYTERGGIVVGVRRKGNLTNIMVYDTGVGIPAEKTKQIFIEYQRLEYAKVRVYGGIGLGLAICERLAKLLGFTLRVDSQLGRGSSFGIVTPSYHPNTFEQSFKNLNPTLNDIYNNFLHQKRVVILDDDIVISEHLESLLSSWGLDVSIALSGSMVLELIEADGLFDIILSDYHLGLDKETGIDIIHHIRSSYPQKPIFSIIITGDTTSDITNICKENDVQLLHKPLQPLQLRSTLNNLFSKHESHT